MNLHNKLNKMGNTILVLGDGNLSFSLALSELYPQKKIFATVLEKKTVWLEKYGDAGKQIIEKIGQYSRTEIVFEVDATRLTEHSHRRYSDIVFNFPHQGGKTNLKKSRVFLRTIFKSVASNLMSRTGQNYFHLTLASKQSGLNPDDVNERRNFKATPPNHEKDSWTPLELAAEYGLCAVCVGRFNQDLFPEYKPSGYLNTDKAFNTTGDAHTITFKWIGHLTGPGKIRLQTAKFLEMAGQRLRRMPYSETPTPIFHQFRPVHEYHTSILFANSHKTSNADYMENLERKMFKTMFELAGPFLVNVFEMPKLRCLALPRREHNRIYCMQYQGLALPLCKELANNLQTDFCEKLSKLFEEMNCGLVVATRSTFQWKN